MAGISIAPQTWRTWGAWCRLLRTVPTVSVTLPHTAGPASQPAPHPPPRPALLQLPDLMQVAALLGTAQAAEEQISLTTLPLSLLHILSLEPPCLRLFPQPTFPVPPDPRLHQGGCTIRAKTGLRKWNLNLTLETTPARPLPRPALLQEGQATPPMP